MSNDIYATPVLSRQSFTLGGVRFLDRNGAPYAPATVEKRVVTEDGTVITNWTTVAGFTNGSDIPITATETALQDADALTERHIILIVGDRNLAAENPLRIIVQILNREKLPS